MNLESLQSFFGWCSLINYTILLVWAVAMLLARTHVYNLHRKWFPLSDAELDRCVYICVGVYKILVVTFNVVPWIVLRFLT